MAVALALGAAAALPAAGATTDAQTGAPTPVNGRSVTDPEPSSASATRAALTTALGDAERRGDQATAESIRRRLTEGDVGPGDQLEVSLTLDSVAQYKFVVRDGQRVDVLPLGSLSLRGVLRSELPEAFRRFYLQYYRNPEVRVQSLIRVGFLGAVQRPGYYTVAPDAPVADVFTAVAGGPGGLADLKKVEVKRGDRRLYDRRGYERVARDGLTFDEAGMRSGDELRIGERRQRNVFLIVRTVLLVISAVTTLLFLVRSAYNN